MAISLHRTTILSFAHSIMTDPDTALIDQIRDASRRLVRNLGFMNDSLAGVGLPPSAIHALLEIEARQGGITAGEIAGLLGLDKSSVSRMLRKLVEAGAVAELPGAADGRVKTLSLTEAGCGTVAAIHAFARRQVSGALERLGPSERRTVREGLDLYADALSAERAPRRLPADITIETGYRSGALARCIEMHARYYAAAAGFGLSFEAIVAAGLGAFCGRLERPQNGLWLAVQDDRIVGTVAVDGEDLGGNIAHLRWFIVDDSSRGSGAGTRLLAAAIAFCERQRFDAIHLWTFHGLHAARHLYEKHGFALVEEWQGRQWGSEVLEQRFVRPGG